MTRINLVGPSVLTDKHLMAEYRELPRIFTAVVKLQEQGKSPLDIEIPPKYVLGKGHCKFFYDKLAWLKARYFTLYCELKRRKFNLDYELFCKIQSGTKDIHADWCELYTPSPEEIYLNMSRLCKRSNIPEVIDELSS